MSSTFLSYVKRHKRRSDIQYGISRTGELSLMCYHERNGMTVVAALEPLTLLELLENQDLGVIAEEVKVRLIRAVERV